MPHPTAAQHTELKSKVIMDLTLHLPLPLPYMLPMVLVVPTVTGPLHGKDTVLTFGDTTLQGGATRAKGPS
jgi:hypothetical protein